MKPYDGAAALIIESRLNKLERYAARLDRVQDAISSIESYAARASQNGDVARFDAYADSAFLLREALRDS